VRLALRFVRRQPEADDTCSYLFEPQPPFRFQAGQHLRYLLPHPAADERGLARPFTIASSPAEPLVRLTTRLSTPPSTFKAALARLEPGTVVEADGPFGHFVYSDDHRPSVLIAGGIGITPFRAMLGDLAARNVRATVTLLYSNRTPDIPFRAFLDHLRPGWPELQVVYTVTRPSAGWQGLTDHIDGGFIRRHVAEVSQSRFYLCGPTPLVDALRATLAACGVERALIKHEPFPGYSSRGAPQLLST
jgi:ferredoxin-NADP reductase